jgi:HEAT repeat protein
MSTTHTQVRAYLEPDEPDYRAAAAALGPEALPVLEELVQGADPLLASKAVYLASLIPDERAARLLEQAAHSSHATVRVAVAAGLQQRPEVTDDVTVDLLTDVDQGVRKVAEQSVRLTPALRDLIAERASSTQDAERRAAAQAAGPSAPGEGGGFVGDQQVGDAATGPDPGSDDASGGGGDLGSGLGYLGHTDDGPDGGGFIESAAAGGVPTVTQHGGGQI